uniref:Uncharacterized protein n=1 Tax=Periophthalmus magnuspinnatus TaxID=409849 RepID=A0A3B4AIG8_9GOBI
MGTAQHKRVIVLSEETNSVLSAVGPLCLQHCRVKAERLGLCPGRVCSDSGPVLDCLTSPLNFLHNLNFDSRCVQSVVLNALLDMSFNRSSQGQTSTFPSV